MVAPLLAALLIAAAQPAPPGGPRPQAAVTPRPGDVEVQLSPARESPELWQRLAALGWVEARVLNVMYAGENGRRVCRQVYFGYLPAASLAAARKLPGVGALAPVSPSPRP